MVDTRSIYTAASDMVGDPAAYPFDNDNADYDYDYGFRNSQRYLSPEILRSSYRFTAATSQLV